MITPDQSPTSLPSLDELPTEDFLLVVGQRVRLQRARKSMSRKRLAEVSRVSERYLAQLESGQGNMSIALLRKVTTAIGMSLGALMAAEVTETCAQNTSLANSTSRQRSAGSDQERSQASSKRADEPEPAEPTAAIRQQVSLPA
jgi:transcriptional regulator with XRE-family HTH domain